ncbi:response regulator transcription factor [Neisseriaceae bacterium TC5R-5]|nr:response regulator transcription factor [Neisseriaceae bacterium TC5R-5]
MSSSIRILLIDDHTLFRSGLKALLQRQQDFEIVGEAADGLEGVKQAELLKPDVVLLDLDMPVMHGRDALVQLLISQPQLAILMLTVSEDGEDLAECMRQGARGYLLKNIHADFLLASIRRAVAGDSVLSPEMTAKLVARLRQPDVAPQNAELASLTPRERETLSHLAKGVSNKEIARALELAESTVKVHVQNILRKLNLSSRVQAAVYAVERGLDKNSH